MYNVFPTRVVQDMYLSTPLHHRRGADLLSCFADCRLGAFKLSKGTYLGKRTTEPSSYIRATLSADSSQGILPESRHHIARTGFHLQSCAYLTGCPRESQARISVPNIRTSGVFWTDLGWFTERDPKGKIGAETG